jgi:3-phosphoshikimate 1-carboxyvinyltransferase
MSQIPQSVIVHPRAELGGKIEVPGDKSISHRVAMMAALASGTTKVSNYLQSEDCVNTLRAMEALGARSFFSEDGELSIQGTGGNLMEPAGQLNVGNSGTTMRLLSGVLAGQPGTYEMTGDDSLCSRPMTRIKEPLERMGAKVELTGEKGTAPIKITGGKLKAINYTLPVASAQVKSCLLLAGLFADGTTSVTEPIPTRDHTERLFRTLHLPISVDGLTIQIKGLGGEGPSLKARPFRIPGDFSSAAFWLVAAAARKNSEVSITGVGLNPRRIALLDVLRRAGARVEVSLSDSNADAEPVGDIRVMGGKLKAVEVGGADIPNLIDELPLVAVLGALAEGTTIIRNAAELRVKESDRIATMATNLRLLGVEVEEREDGMAIVGGGALKPTSPVRSYGDHRIAMAMAVLATCAEEPVVINNVACVDTSYPGFWNDLKRIGGQVE